MQNYWRLLLLVVILIPFVWIGYIFLYLQPSNNRNWEVGMDLLPQFEISGNKVSIQNVRDYHFDVGKTVSTGYVNRLTDAANITRVWLVQEPFAIKPFTDFKGVAHTYFVFDFTDQNPLIVSVEARRTKDEKYDAFKGVFNQYELIYIWGTEEDETVSRVVVQNNKLYMYPLQISKSGAEKLFLQLAETSRQLETAPRFYNTFSSNCTNELAKAANQVKPGSIPFNRALFFPGYSDLELYKLGYLPNNLSFDQLKQKYYISDLVRSYYKDANFSAELRLNLPAN